MAGLKLRVLTPRRVALEREADFVVLRCVEGDKGVLPGHERFVARLSPGMLRVFVNKSLTDSLFVMGGTARVEDNTVTVLSELAGGPEDVQRALSAIEGQLEERRQEEQRSDVEIHRAEVALRSALVQMDVSSYTILGAKRGEHDE